MGHVLPAAVCAVLVAGVIATPAAAIAPVHQSKVHQSKVQRVAAPGLAKHAAGDIDGDGKSDLVIASEHGLRIYYTSASPGGSHVQSFALPDGEVPVSVAVGDFNGDGFADVAVGSPYSHGEDGEIFVYYGGHGGLNPAAATKLPGPAGQGESFGYTIIAIDLNHDGKRDLLEHGGLSAGRFLVIFGSSTGLTMAGRQHLAIGDVNAIATGDINGDGRPDLVVGQPDDGKESHDEDGETGSEGIISVYLGTKHGGYAAKPERVHGRAAGVGYGAIGGSIAIAKVNGDKYDDVIAGATDTTVHHRGDAGAVVVLYGGHDGLSAKRRTVISLATKGVPGEAHSEDALGTIVVAGDFNGDGYADVAASAPDIDNGRKGEVLALQGSKHGLTAHHAKLFNEKSLPGLPKPGSDPDGYGDALVTLHPRGLSYASIAIGAPDYGPSSSKFYYGFVDVIRGSKSGLSLKGSRRIVGTTLRESLGQALGA